MERYFPEKIDRSDQIKRIKNYIKPHWKRLSISLILTVLVAASTAAVAWLVKPVMDDIFLKKDVTLLTVFPLIIIAIYIVKGIAIFAQSYLIRQIGQRVIMKVREDLYGHIQTMSLGFFHKYPSAVLMSRFTNDISRLANISSAVVANFFRELFSLLGLICVALSRDWKLTLIALTVLPAASVPITKVTERLRKFSRKTRDKNAEMNNFLQESFTGIKIVKIFCREKYEKEKFNNVNNKIYRLTMKTVKADEIISPVMELIGSLAIALVIWYGGLQVIKGTSTPGTFFSFIAAVMMMYGPVRKLARMNNNIQQSLASSERVFGLLNMAEEEVIDKGKGVKPESFKEKITFEGVTFSYEKDDGIVLKDIDLHIHRGEIVALVGSSGAGKTTLCSLIPRFYDVNGGRILIDDIDIRSLDLKWLRQQIGLVTQENLLFNDTVSNNISYGKEDASIDEIKNAAQIAYAHDFITDMTNGYNTVIGEKATRLSGGEAQRIAIARAILKNPAILILDEATSELDSESETIVQKALDNLMKNRTTIVIAHRLTTVFKADRIVVLENGEIIETGTHEELFNNGGTYKRLFELQFMPAIK
ncbi:MAG: ABC transporter ATP-binding protein [Thermodesulfobacteriota bacterium]|nr:ABC transporter ATP-binding protein [Thermodesulfobacteriota bacterium]